jgi:NDP-sugar pyrophosphorylase family protein
MQAVILAAGKGVRMGELTKDTPKPMLKILGKTLLEYKLEALPENITEIIIIVGYLADSITGHFGDSWHGKPIRYVHMKPEALFGTGFALAMAKKYLHEKFIVMMGDDIYSPNDIQKMLLAKNWALLVSKTNSMTRGGRVVLDEKGKVKDIVEGENHGGGPGILYTGLCVLTPGFFRYPLVKLPGKNEYGLPQTILQAVGDIPIESIETTSWITITDPSDLQKAEEILKKRK